MSIIQLLHSNGVDVANSKAAYEELKKFESNPSFCILLSHIFGSEDVPVPNLGLTAGWARYRQLAGITLKNNLESARHALGEDAVREAGRYALRSLQNPPDARIARTSAQIIVKITSLTSFEWWLSAELGDIPDILLNQLLPAGQLQTLAALYCLQYLMEDLPRQIGEASESIIVRVSQLALLESSPLDVRKAAFRMCFNIFEQSSLLDWNVDTFSPLQKGLVSASARFSNTCTSLLEAGCCGDAAFMILVLRSCVFLLDYFDYFGTIDSVGQNRYCEFWVNNSVRIMCNEQHIRDGNQELVSAAIDLITCVLEMYNRNEGEGASAFLVSGIGVLIPTMVPALARYSMLSDEEVSNIMDSDDYRIRDNTAVSFAVKGGTKDISQDDLLDDEEAAMTLRRSALKCIDNVSTFSSLLAFHTLIGQIQQLWCSGDWRDREAGIVLVGTIASGCSDELEGVLQSLVTQILQFVSNPSEHVCVVSIASWALSRLVDSLLKSSPDTVGTIIPVLTARLQSTSKRIQISTVSALNTIIEMVESYGDMGMVIRLLPTLLESVYACLPVYSTINLSVLVDFLTKLIEVLNVQSEVERLSSILQGEHLRRASLFGETYTAMYVRGETNALLDKDIFSLDRAIIAFLSKYPDSNTALSSLSTWNDVLHDILNRGVTDDADLIFNTLLMCSAYTTTISTEALKGWISETSWSLPTAAVHFFTNSTVYQVKISAVTLLCTLLRSLGSHALSPGVQDVLLSKASAELPEEEDPQYKSYLINLVCLIIVNSPTELSETGFGALQTANATLRSDIYAETLYHFASMSFSLCRVFGALPQLVNYFRVDVICQLLSQSENSLEKSEATIGLCKGMTAVSTEVLARYLSDVMRVVYSWQQAATHYPGTFDALKLFLHHTGRTCGPQLQMLLQGLPNAFRQMIAALYQLE